MKKIFIVFMVILLLGLTIVPSFAVSDPVDYQIYIYNYNSQYRWYNNNLSTFSYDFLGNYSFTTYVGGYSGLSIIPSALSNLSLGHTYLISFDFVRDVVTSGITLNLYSTTYIYQKSFENSYGLSGSCSLTFELLEATKYIWLFFGTSSEVNYTLSNFNFIDLSELEDSFDFSTYGLDSSEFIPSGYYRIPDFFTTYGEFTASLIHAFDWLPDLVSEYNVFLAFFGITLGSLIVVFLFVFFFKRLRG